MLRGRFAEPPHVRVARHTDDEPREIGVVPPDEPADRVDVRPETPGHRFTDTITTGRVSGRSASLKLRPRTISMPAASKNPGSTSVRSAILGEAKQLRGLRNPAAKGDLVFRSMRGKALHGTMISTLVRELRIAAVPHVVPIVVPGTGLRNGRTTRGRSSRRRWRTW
jgi:hypothetical protein